MYWATGAAHGPHHTLAKWADKYKGKFDDGWDRYRERTFARQKAMGWIPSNTVLTPRDSTMASWESIPESEKPFQRRLMEVFAGFAEQADHDAGRIVDVLEKLGLRENTLIFYIWGDNGSSAEGQMGSISELLAQNQIPTKIEDHIKAANELGGLNVLGTPKADNMYHAGWAWAGSTPFKGTKLQGAYFGGTRQPLAISWPQKIKANKTPHTQFSHVNDIAPTIYQVLNITPPATVNGFAQDPIDGVSLMYSFNDGNAKTQKPMQFFDVMGSRGIYSDGWFACTFGPRIPWLTVSPGLATWTPDKDKWELYNLEEDFSQANNLAEKMPQKLAGLKELFDMQSAENKNLPIGGGLWVLYHPEDAIQNPASSFRYVGSTTRIPEFSAPKIGSRPHTITVDADISENASGVLFALGAFSGGLTCYLENGVLNYEYNLFEIKRTMISSKTKLPKGKTTIEIAFKPKPSTVNKGLHAADIIITANGKEVARGEIPTLITLAFTANDCLDIGCDLGSPVSLAYYEKAPFKFNGVINTVDIKYSK
ncbi:Arylsulfatase [compost metagenome]